MPYDTPLSPQNAQAPPTSAGEGIEKTPETLIEIEHARYRKKFREPDSPLAQRLLTNIIIAIKGELKKHPINEYEPTELGQAEAAAEYLQSLIRYSPALGWLVYDFNEGRYRTDYGEMVLYGVLKYLAKERSSIDFSTKVDKATIVYAEKTVTKSGISNVAGLLKTDPSVYCLPTDFDADPYLLNCKGITYNLKTGEREISVPEHMHTKTAAFEPVQGKMDRFFEFLAEITCGDKGLGACLMRWFGY
jgi:phage/plasmid-associated DNA primase